MDFLHAFVVKQSDSTITECCEVKDIVYKDQAEVPSLPPDFY